MLTKYLRKINKNHEIIIVMVFVGVVAFVVSSSILDAFFLGEDEAIYIRLTNLILSFVRKGDMRNVFISLLNHDHPPMPIIFATPFIYLMGYSEAALRMPSILLWVISCMVATKIGWRLGGLWVGFVSGFFLAISGIYDIICLGFGEASEILFVLLLIDILLDNFIWNLDTPVARRKYFVGGVYLAFGYLFYTSTLPIIIMYHLIFGFKMLKSDMRLVKFWQYFIYTIPFVIFYLIYNAIFLGIPAYEAYALGIEPYGQLRQNLIRSATSLNIDSFKSNLQVMNFYIFPICGWILLLLGLYSQFKTDKRIFLILLGYGLIWSFYFNGNTGQHFLAYFCYAVPFGIYFICRLFQNRSRFIITSMWFTVFGVLFAWTYFLHIRTYTYDTYPRDLIYSTWSQNLGWVNNVYRPLREIGNKLNNTLGGDGKYISLIDGALHLYYFPDQTKYFSELSQLEIRQDITNKCLFLPPKIIHAHKVIAIVTYSDLSICSELIDEVISYPESNLQLTILKQQ